MPKHKCNKEAELAVIASDIKHIREKIDEALDDDKGWITKQVKENSIHRIGQNAKSDMMRYLVGSGWCLTIAGFIWMVIRG